MRERELRLPPMDVPEALEELDPSGFGDGYYSPSMGGVLASYDAPRAETVRLAHQVAKRLLR
jgi:hypothetical protein